MTVDSAVSLLTTVAVSAATGFASGLVAWAAGVFLGKPIARLHELRLEAHRLMFVYANVIDVPNERARIDKAQAELRAVAAEIDALRTVLPSFIQRALAWRGYDLEKAIRGLTGLSNSLISKEGVAVFQRITARRGLRLPVDPAELQAAELVRQRLLRGG